MQVRLGEKLLFAGENKFNHHPLVPLQYHSDSHDIWCFYDVWCDESHEAAPQVRPSHCAADGCGVQLSTVTGIQGPAEMFCIICCFGLQTLHHASCLDHIHQHNP